MDMICTYHQGVVIWRCDCHRNETLADILEHLANSLASSRSSELLSEFSRDVNRCAKLDDGP